MSDKLGSGTVWFKLYHYQKLQFVAAGFASKVESHQRQLVDRSSPT